MGGKSSSSSSSSQTTNQIDQRIAAQDSAIVLKDSAGAMISRTDYGAIDAAGGAIIKAFDNNLAVTQGGYALAESSLDSITDVALEVVRGGFDLGSNSLDAISRNAETAFSFVDKQRQDAETRLITEIMPWLIGGASIIAIAVAWRNK